MAESAKSADPLPPYSNRGVTLGAVIENIGDFLPRFDAYCGTVYAHPLMVLHVLEQALLEAGFNPRREDGPPVRFYARNTLLLAPEGHRLLSVRHGGQNHHPFVECKGEASAAVSEALRGTFDHCPSRIDSAYDLSGPDVMRELYDMARQFERERGVKFDLEGAAIDNPDRGTTVYLGSRKSQVYVRIYQKGLKTAHELGLCGDAIPDELRHWVRVEIELKPDKRPARMKAARLSPAAVWGCSPWASDFAKHALSIDAERVHMNERRESDQDKRMRFLVSQYGPTILEQVERLGSWDRFVEDLQERLGLLEPA